MTTFQLTEQSFKKMRDNGISEEIVRKLNELKNIVYYNENAFIKVLEEKIGVEETNIHKTIIMSCAFNMYFAVMAFFNIIITGVLAILFYTKLTFLLPLCVRPDVITLIFAITALFLGHLCWRFLRSEIIALGEIVTIKWFITISISKLNLLLDALHPWWIDSCILFFINIILFFIVGVSYVYSPFFLRPIDETIPNIQSFFIKGFDTNEPMKSIKPDNMLTITTKERIWVSPTQAETEDHTACCEWFSNRGRLDHSGKSCSILYTAPLKEGNDTLTLRMQSPCKTQEAYASLHIRIVKPLVTP